MLSRIFQLKLITLIICKNIDLLKQKNQVFKLPKVVLRLWSGKKGRFHVEETVSRKGRRVKGRERKVLTNHFLRFQ